MKSEQFFMFDIPAEQILSLKLGTLKIFIFLVDENGGDELVMNADPQADQKFFY